jgi:hypothetical protein
MPSVHVAGRDSCAAALNDAGTVRLVPDDAAADVIVEFRRRSVTKQKIGGALLAGFTFFLVPAKLDETSMFVEAHVLARRSGERRTVRAERTTATWAGVFLFPFTFTRFPITEVQRAERGLCDELAIEVHRMIDALLVDEHP